MSENATARLSTLLGALAADVVPADSQHALLAQLAPYFEVPVLDRVWLALSVLQAKLPTREEVLDAGRQIRLNGASDVLNVLVRSPARRGAFGIGPARRVRVITEAVVVDVHHTAQTGLATGIQRVVRKSIDRWDAGHEIVLVGWSVDYGGIRVLSPEERENALHGTKPTASRGDIDTVAVPWRCTYLLPELAIEEERTARIAALAEFSGNRTAAIGYDCVPLTSAETTGVGMGGAFAKNLAALARFDRVATISDAAAVEYRGWRRMLSGAGLAGPDIREIMLPADAGAVTAEELARAEADLVIDSLPLLLCVGSHEPRKNHLAVLNAAERLWREGRQFCLAFVGGNSWGSRHFSDELRQLQAKGRPVKTISAISDELLWGGYIAARATVFPSLNEGFGLPVAESLAMGTPVVTSRYGSMREIAEAGGAVLVDPRNDADVARGIAEAMFDEAANARLRAEAAARRGRGWGDYASSLWDYFGETP